MVDKRLWAVLTMAWAFVALLAAALGLPERAEDLRVAMAIATTFGVAGGVGAALALATGRRYLAGVGLIVSAFTPTGLPLANGAALIAGFVLAVRAARGPEHAPDAPVGASSGVSAG